MAAPITDPVALTQELIRIPSVTPDAAAALDLAQGWLEALGFACRRLTFEGGGSYPVDNLYARVGEGPPHLCFAGHVDVVPPGEVELWTHPPFAAEIASGLLYGRGAADMKGAIACFTAAALGGSISLPGLDGAKIDIKIPPGIQSGEQLRQRGAGMSVLNGRGRGDLVAKVLVETPRRMSVKQKKLLEEFRKTETGDESPAAKSFFQRVRESFGS